MSRAAAKAIHDTARAHAARQRNVMRATVTGLEPMTVELHHSNRTLEIDDDFDLTGNAQLYDTTRGIAAGDTVLLMHEGGSWSLFDVQPEALPPSTTDAPTVWHPSGSDFVAPWNDGLAGDGFFRKVGPLVNATLYLYNPGPPDPASSHLLTGIPPEFRTVTGTDNYLGLAGIFVTAPAGSHMHPGAPWISTAGDLFIDGFWPAAVAPDVAATNSDLWLSITYFTEIVPAT